MQETNMKQAAITANSEDGYDMFLGNVGWFLPDYTALYPIRWIFS
jgi:hypothetical protein